MDWFFDDLARHMERIELISSDKLPDNIQPTVLGKGELESISYALETKSVLLTNDKKAGEFAEDLGVSVLDIVSFLLLCKEINLLGISEIEHIIDSLKKYTEFHYGLNVLRLRGFSLEIRSSQSRLWTVIHRWQ